MDRRNGLAAKCQWKESYVTSWIPRSTLFCEKREPVMKGCYNNTWYIRERVKCWRQKEWKKGLTRRVIESFFPLPLGRRCTLWKKEIFVRGWGGRERERMKRKGERRGGSAFLRNGMTRLGRDESFSLSLVSSVFQTGAACAVIATLYDTFIKQRLILTFTSELNRERERGKKKKK